MPEVRIVVPKDMDKALDALVKLGFAGNKAELARAALTHFLSTLPTQIPKGYDLETAFSPDGRVFQIEFAKETTRRGGTIVGIRCAEGVVLAKELLEEDPFVITPNPFIEIFKVHEDIGIVYCGLQTDGCAVVEEAVKQVDFLKKKGSVDIETLSRKLLLFMQTFGQRKDVRPLGTSLIIGGIDAENKPRVFLLEVGASAQEYEACAKGTGEDEGRDILKEEYKPDLSLEDAKKLALKVALRETRKPENVLLATIDSKTRTFKEVTLEERERMWKKISR